MKRKHCRVLFLCKKRIDEYGKSYGLLNSATFVCNYLRSIGVESKVVSVIDGNFIDAEVYSYQPTHVILEALWATPEKMEELLKIGRYKDILWFIRIHSKLPFLANEGIALPWLVRYGRIQATYRNFYISANTKEILHDLHDTLGIRGKYLPNVYYPDKNKVIRSKKEEGVLDVGCFGSIRPMKNHLIQAMAAIGYCEDRDIRLRFHINSNRIEQKGDNVYKNLRGLFDDLEGHELVEHDWMDHEEFIKLVATMDIGLQVSMSETFNIVVADFAWNNVPVIGSKDIGWMPSMFRASPNSTEDIKEKMDLILNTIGLYRLNKLALLWYNHNAEEEWDDLVY